MKDKGPPPPVTEPSPQVRVEELPKGDFKVTGKQWVGRGEGGGFMNRQGFYEALSGTTGETIRQWEDYIGNNASLVISVEEGKVRGYLQNNASDKAKGGYHYVEATPGKPAQTVGYLMYGGGQLYIKVQAVDGVAKGVRFHVWGGKH